MTLTSAKEWGVTNMGKAHIYMVSFVVSKGPLEMASWWLLGPKWPFGACSTVWGTKRGWLAPQIEVKGGKTCFCLTSRTKIGTELNSWLLSPLLCWSDPFLALESGILAWESAITHLCCPLGSIGLVQQLPSAPEDQIKVALKHLFPPFVRPIAAVGPSPKSGQLETAHFLSE